MTMKCHLWKPKSDNLLAICDLRDDPTKFPFYSFTVDDYIFNYKSKNIKFISDSFGTFFQKSPFIYSDEQTIDLSDEKDVYYFKFKTGLFYDTQLFLYDKNNQNLLYIPFDGCSVKERIMTCKMTRKKIESFVWRGAIRNEAYYSTLSFNIEYSLKINYPVYPITIIKNKEKQKEDVYVEITNIISNSTESYSFITYETNVTNISVLETRYIDLFFTNDKDTYEHRYQCIFKKNEDDTPLILLCLLNIRENTTLTMKSFQFQNPYELLSYNYNFFIKYTKNESFTIRGSGNYILGK